MGQANEQVFVNAATGNLVVQGQDDTLSSLGVDLGVLRAYNSLGEFDGDNDDNWRLGFLSSVSLTSGSFNQVGSEVTRITADGASQMFGYDDTQGAYVSTDGAGAHDTLVYDKDADNEEDEPTWFYTEGGSLVQMHYNVDGKLSAILDKEGKGQRLHYDVEDKLTTITTDIPLSDTTTSTETTTLTYTGDLLASIMLSSEDGEALTSYVYGYDTDDRLQTVTVVLSPEDGVTSDGNVYVTTYAYHGTSTQLASITQSDGTTWGLRITPRPTRT